MTALSQPETASYRLLHVQIVAPTAVRPRALPEDYALSLKWAYYPYTSVRADGQHDIRSVRFQPTTDSPDESTDSSGAKKLYDLLYGNALQATSRIHGILTEDWKHALKSIAIRPSGQRTATLKNILSKHRIECIIPAVLGLIGRLCEGLGPMANYLDLLFPVVNDNPPSNPNVIRTRDPVSFLGELDDAEDAEGAEEEEDEDDEREGPEEGDATPEKSAPRRWARRIARTASRAHAVHMPSTHAAIPIVERTPDDDAAFMSWFHDPSLSTDKFQRRLHIDRIIPLQVFPFVLLVLQDIYIESGDASARRECKKINDPFEAIRMLVDVAGRVRVQCNVMHSNSLLHAAISVDPDEELAVSALHLLAETILPGIEEVVTRCYDYTGPGYIHGSYGAWRSIGVRLNAVEAQLDAILADRDMTETGAETPFAALLKAVDATTTAAADNADPGITMLPPRFAAGKLTAQRESVLVATFDARIKRLEATLAGMTIPVHVPAPPPPPPNPKKRKLVKITVTPRSKPP